METLQEENEYDLYIAKFSRNISLPDDDDNVDSENNEDNEDNDKAVLKIIILK